MTTTLHDRTVPGAALTDGTTVVDRDGREHHIDHFKPYPGRFVGGARRAYEQEDETGWCCTVCDHEPFHIRVDEELER